MLGFVECIERKKMHDRLFIRGKLQIVTPDPHIALTTGWAGDGDQETLGQAKIASPLEDLGGKRFAIAIVRRLQIFKWPCCTPAVSKGRIDQ